MLKWEGRVAFEYTRPVNELKEWIPLFNRVPFALHNGGTNEYLDMIIRVALPTDGVYAKDRQNIPVSISSKQYRLVQHRDVFKALVHAVELVASDLQPLEAALKITEYGEKMWVSFVLENHQLNQAEKYPFRLEVNGLNTIKPGTALDVRLSWYEPNYKIRFPYGMLSSHEVKFKKIKRKREKELDSNIIADEIFLFLVNHLNQLSRERQLYTRWIEAKVNQDTIADWIDRFVEKKWNYQMAASVYNIAINGYDVHVKQQDHITDIGLETEKTEKIPPSELTRYYSSPEYFVRKDPAPERFAPVKNAFDISLVLGWVLSLQTTIPMQLKWVDITGLMEELIAMDDNLQFHFKRSRS